MPRAIDVAELEAQGLYDPAASDAPDRLALLEYLVSLGASIEDMTQVGTQLEGVAAALILRGNSQRFRVSEAAARAGVPLEQLQRLWRSLGLPDPGPDAHVYNDEDVELVGVFSAGIELLGEDVAFQLARVVGAAMARIADAEVSAFLLNVGEPLFADDPSGLALARANAAAATLLRAASGSLDILLRRHIEVSQRPLNPDGQGSVHLTVGFADLVGSTALAQELTFAELSAAIGAFDAIATEAVASHAGRIVKFIGDEVMFVAYEAAAACAIALDIVEALRGHTRLPAARVGLATGASLTRDGDYFGPVVNLAARAAALAEPNTIVVSSEVVAASAPTSGLRFASLGTRALKGFRDPIELFVLDSAPG